PPRDPAPGSEGAPPRARPGGRSAPLHRRLRWGRRALLPRGLRGWARGNDREAGRRSLPGWPTTRLAQDQVPAASGVRDRRLHRPEGLARSPGRRPPGGVRDGRSRLRRSRRLGPRCRRAPRSPPATSRARDRRMPVHAGGSAAGTRASLGASRARLRGALHGVDGRRCRPPSGLPGAARRQAAARRAARGRGASRLIGAIPVLARAGGSLGARPKKSWVALLDFDRDAPQAGLGGHARDVVSLGFGGAGNVARALGVVEEEVDLLAALERLEGELRFCPTERALDAAEVEYRADGFSVHGGRERP